MSCTLTVDDIIQFYVLDTALSHAPGSFRIEDWECAEWASKMNLLINTMWESIVFEGTRAVIREMRHCVDQCHYMYFDRALIKELGAVCSNIANRWKSTETLDDAISDIIECFAAALHRTALNIDPHTGKVKIVDNQLDCNMSHLEKPYRLAIQQFDDMMNGQLPSTMESVLTLLEYLYNGGLIWEGGYGGEKWGIITKALREFYIAGKRGTVSSVMLDTLINLVHNNATWLDKFTNGGELLSILNTKASKSGIIALRYSIRDRRLRSFFTRSLSGKLGFSDTLRKYGTEHQVSVFVEPFPIFCPGNWINTVRLYNDIYDPQTLNMALSIQAVLATSKFASVLKRGRYTTIVGANSVVVGGERIWGSTYTLFNSILDVYSLLSKNRTQIVFASRKIDVSVNNDDWIAVKIKPFVIQPDVNMDAVKLWYNVDNYRCKLSIKSPQTFWKLGGNTRIYEGIPSITLMYNTKTGIYAPPGFMKKHTGDDNDYRFDELSRYLDTQSDNASLSVAAQEIAAMITSVNTSLVDLVYKRTSFEIPLKAISTKSINRMYRGMIKPAFMGTQPHVAIDTLYKTSITNYEIRQR